jgi:hypothetical protein
MEQRIVIKQRKFNFFTDLNDFLMDLLPFLKVLKRAETSKSFLRSSAFSSNQEFISP